MKGRAAAAVGCVVAILGIQLSRPVLAQGTGWHFGKAAEVKAAVPTAGAPTTGTASTGTASIATTAPKEIKVRAVTPVVDRARVVLLWDDSPDAPVVREAVTLDWVEVLLLADEEPSRTEATTEGRGAVPGRSSRVFDRVFDRASGAGGPHDRRRQTFDPQYVTNHLKYASSEQTEWRNVRDTSLVVEPLAVSTLTMKGEAQRAFLAGTGDGFYRDRTGAAPHRTPWVMWNIRF